MKTLCDYLEAWGGSRDIDAYKVVNWGERTRGLQVKQRIDGEGDLMCLCGKEDIINLFYIQLENDATAPLLLVGSVCVNKFMKTDDKSKTRRICFRCRKPLRSKTEEVCKKCKIEEALEKADEERMNKKAEAFNRRRLLKMAINVWKQQTPFYIMEQQQERIKQEFRDATGISYERYDEWTLNFGKFDGKNLKHIDASYLLWMYNKGINLCCNRKMLLLDVSPPSCFLKNYVEARQKLNEL